MSDRGQPRHGPSRSAPAARAVRARRYAVGVAALSLAMSIAATTALSQDDDPSGEDPAAEPAADSEGPPPGATANARKTWLRARLESLIAERPLLADARIGIAVWDPAIEVPADAVRAPDTEDPRLLYGRDPDGAYNVASNTKLVTASAALALLGPEFQYHTALYADAIASTGGGAVKGDLYLRGRGDPSFGRAHLATLADEVAQAGISQVRGGIVIDDSYFDDQVSPPHFDEQPEEQAGFRAPVAAVSVSFSAYTVRVRPARSGSGPAVVAVEPASDYVRVTDNAVITQRSGRNRVRIVSAEVDGRVELRVWGRVRAGSGSLRYRRRAPDPVMLFGASLRQALIDRGVRVRDAEIRRGPIPDAAIRIASVESEPLGVLVDGMGKFSNNHVAEALLKTVGAETRARGRPATWEDGLAAVSEFLTEEIGLEPGSFRVSNGSGLFDASRLSPRQVVMLLAAAHRDMRWGPELVASLSIAGADGTLRLRMAGTAAERQVRAKTGTLAAVSALGGYAAARADRPLVFAIFVNDIPDRRGAFGDARGLQDDIAAELVRYLRDES